MNNTNATTKATRNITTFFALTFLISLPIWILTALTTQFIPEEMPMNPIGILMVFTPITAAFILTYRENGLDTAKKLLKRSFDHKRITGKLWYVPIFFLMPVIYFSSLGLMISVGIPIPENPIPVVATPILFLIFFIMALGEEVGWQGYAFDPMEKRWNALNASIVLGIIWTIWHIPLLSLQNLQGGTLWIAGQCTNLAVTRILIVWIFNNTGKSVFAAILIHAVDNTFANILPIYSSPLGPIIASIFIIVTTVIVTYLWGFETLSQFKFKKKE
ncbi:MAG: CPBP family intramembrane metalloprotease [Candidatus Bathyarchaeota archaeon]|nr:CPBP family intramembrane metalloprotease [Candidatus Bathyarchaeota archaeon]